MVSFMGGFKYSHFEGDIGWDKVTLNYKKIKGDVKDPQRKLNTLAVTILRVFCLHLPILLPCEWWGRGFLNQHRGCAE